MTFDGEENGYQFAYYDDAELFEGTQVEVLVGNARCGGRIVAAGEGSLLLALDSDFGPVISACTLRVDNTIFLEALRQRIEQIMRGEVQQFNKRLAHDVIGNVGPEAPPAPSVVAKDAKLKKKQREAIAKALSNDVLYIWGPPGTGKTTTLSHLTSRLFEAGKRVLICSNTNQAVDQVLLQLCKTMGTKHPAIQEGRVVRIGRFEHEELEKHWKSYVSLDGIVERRSESLKSRLTHLQQRIQQLDRHLSLFNGILKDFHMHERLRTELAQSVEHQEKLNKERLRLEEAVREVESKARKLDQEKERVESAGALRRVFMRSAEAIEQELSGIVHDLQDAKSAVERSVAAMSSHGARMDALSAQVSALAQRLGRYARAEVQRRVSELERDKQQIADEIAQINRELEDLARSIVEQARVVGATVTKTFISPQAFPSFDVVIVDEASMVLLPAVFYVSGLAKERVIISGDFCQLSPIVPSRQKAIMKAIGSDVFKASNTSDAFWKGSAKRGVMLDEQHRMHPEICRLVSEIMYEKRLQTASNREAGDKPRAPLFDERLVVVDTSRVWPFVNRDRFNSRYNLMHALVVRNICLHLAKHECAHDQTHLGVCTPYAAQGKLIQRILECYKHQTGEIEAGTVHRYQGGEKRSMILEIPDSYGERSVGMFLEAVDCRDSGARLFNVAISRAKEQLIVVANLTYLDERLPAQAILRDYLHQIQTRGRIVDVQDVLALKPIAEDLRRFGIGTPLDVDVGRTGLFRRTEFDTAFIRDVQNARRSIAIFSGFVTPQRVAKYLDLLRAKLQGGVIVRCVTRPPRNNGTVPIDDGKAALQALEEAGCIVDTRWNIHEKVVIIDDEITWFGSLNPLSHTTGTDEVMARIEGQPVATQIASLLSLAGGTLSDTTGLAVRKENPVCRCGVRATYRRGRYGPYWECEDGCGWTEPTGGSNTRQRTAVDELKGPAPKCPKCGSSMTPRASRFGSFWGCTMYPKCKGMMKANAKSKKTRRG